MSLSLWSYLDASKTDIHYRRLRHVTTMNIIKHGFILLYPVFEAPFLSGRRSGDLIRWSAEDVWSMCASRRKWRPHDSASDTYKCNAWERHGCVKMFSRRVSWGVKECSGGEWNNLGNRSKGQRGSENLKQGIKLSHDRQHKILLFGDRNCCILWWVYRENIANCISMLGHMSTVVLLGDEEHSVHPTLLYFGECISPR